MFIKNNKKKCKILYKNEEYFLDENLEIDVQDNIIEIKLIGINNITNMIDGQTLL